MRVSINRRLVALEGKIKQEGTGGGLDSEIKAMTPPERNRLREYLLFLKNGGQPEGAEYQVLRLAAEGAISIARQRMRDAGHIADLT